MPRTAGTQLGQGPNSLSDERWGKLLDLVHQEAVERGLEGHLDCLLLLIKEHWELAKNDAAVDLQLDEARYDELAVLKPARETELDAIQTEADALAAKLKRPPI